MDKKTFPDGAFTVIPPNGGTIRFMTYSEYIVSLEWRDRVTRYKAEKDWTCEECGTTENITGHHKHYLNLGNELPEDITILCEKCHKKFHNID